MKDKKKLSLWELYLTKEIGIEFKSCLYFFAFLFSIAFTEYALESTTPAFST